MRDRANGTLAQATELPSGTAVSVDYVKTKVSQRFLLCAAAAVLGLPACGGQKAHTFSDHSTGISFRYPHGWTTTGFGRSATPPRLVVASYRVRSTQVEGDCGGSAALRRLPQDGAAVLLIDYGTSRGFRPHPSAFTLSEFQRGDFECFGQTYVLRFRRDGHDIQAHVALGEAADASKRTEALRILDSLK